MKIRNYESSRRAQWLVLMGAEPLYNVARPRPGRCCGLPSIDENPGVSELAARPATTEVFALEPCQLLRRALALALGVASLLIGLSNPNAIALNLASDTRANPVALSSVLLPNHRQRKCSLDFAVSMISSVSTKSPIVPNGFIRFGLRPIRIHSTSSSEFRSVSNQIV